ncbi:uncharacterized protein BJ171DRAFT_494930 [Polychytrium aggregatum]|uniref:uncharacterized protein n=1 Tax=Polychytrium aggregatum TaxID=110093 RepID=UPI0022FECCDA|nr:uncharacterized protein BJ171DRAFT_494930 [Polychytrium aggregatum]KAI9206832.1 hypothetical protein BJ171DRAFT_494930 [Polychytrium aggregatum]
MSLRDYSRAIECFNQSLLVHRYDSTFSQLGECLIQMGEYQLALDHYSIALESSPKNLDFLAKTGLLYFSRGEHDKALLYFGRALCHDPLYAKALLPLCALHQILDEPDAALIKYRITVLQHINSPYLWNNIGMCFYQKEKYVAAAACLKHAHYLLPFSFTIKFNLGLVHLKSGHYCSAAVYFEAAAMQDPSSVEAWMWLAMALAQLQDRSAARAAFDKAFRLKRTEPRLNLNYAVALYNWGDSDTLCLEYVRPIVESAESDLLAKSLTVEEIELARHLLAAVSSSSSSSSDGMAVE